MRIRIVLVVGLVCFYLKTSAQDFSSIRRLGIERGLSNNSVTSIYQDRRGFLWFGTYDGLNRYDGYSIKTFRNKINDSTSLPHNYIYCISEDNQYDLLIGTGQGLSIYSNLTAQFRPAYYKPFAGGKNEKIAASVTNITTDELGNIFVGSNGLGLLYKPSGADIFKQIPVYDNGQPATAYGANTKLDRDGKLWLIATGIGLCTFDSKTEKIIPVDTTSSATHCLAIDNENNLWLGTDKGVYKFDGQRGKAELVFSEAKGGLTVDNVSSLLVDTKGLLWAGTEGGGINIFNPATGSKIREVLPGEDQGSLSSESVSKIFEDKEGRKWIGTLKGGINIIEAKPKSFQIVAHNPLKSGGLPNNFVSCFYEDDNKWLWVGTDGGGISVWDRNSNSFYSYKHQVGNASSLSSNSVTSIRKDFLGDLWISTFGGGINKFDRRSGTFKHYKCINQFTGVENKIVWALCEGSDRKLWATTFSNGKLYLYNRTKDAFEVFDKSLYDLVSIMEDRTGTLWVGNSHQLVKVDKVNKQHVFYEIGKPVRAIFEDKSGSFWLGTEGGGLLSFDRKSGKVILRYSENEGLCNNGVLNIEEGTNGDLWMSTFNGLSCFNPSQKSFKNYYQSDGLQSNQFLYGSSLKLHSRELVFGGIKGFNLFNPDSVVSRKFVPPVLITNIRVNIAPLVISRPYKVKVENDRIIEVKVPYDQAFFSFDFAALEYSSTSRITYKYILEGWDKEWSTTKTLRPVSYSNLFEGSYILRVKATDSDGSWPGSETSFKIIVSPPLYRSWPAYLIYLILVGLAIFGFIRHSKRQAKLAYDIKLARLGEENERIERKRSESELEKEKVQRELREAELSLSKVEREKDLAALESQKMLAEKEREIHEKRLSFFTNISHEFKTPLTLVINPLKDLITDKQDDLLDEHINDLQVVYRNARRMLSLVDQLLLFRKAESGLDTVKSAKINVHRLAHEVFLCFTQQAKQKGIKYEFLCSNKDMVMVADRQKMEMILYNLLSNALKYAPNNREINLIIEETTDAVQLTVQDTGIGIAADIQDKLFEKFYQSPGSEAGFGIGLYLVRHFVEGHGGSVYYESELGKGTSFHATLPKNLFLAVEEDDQDKYSVLPNEIPDPENGIAPAVHTVTEEVAELPQVVTEKHSILIVEDNGQLREYLHQMFQESFMVYETANGDEGLALAKKYQPEIIISDIMLPGLNGVDLCKTIKQDALLNHIPVILLTGNTSMEDRLKAVEGGADDYITKPFEKDLLMARVRSLIQSKNNLQNYFLNEVTLQKNTLRISAEHKEFLDTCIAIVEEHLHDDNFTIQTMATAIGMSYSKLNKTIKAISGHPANAFIRFIRLRKAAEMFIHSNCNVSEAAYAVGIKDIKHFREHFCKLFGMNPSEYIEKYRKNFGRNYTINEKIIR